jgi:hypothetical protein
MKPRHLPWEDYCALKTAFRLLVREVGGLEAATSITRVGCSQLADYYNPHKPDVFAPMDVVLDLEDVAKKQLVTEVMARLGGSRLTGAGRAADTQPSLTQTVAAIIGRSGQVNQAVGVALSDGQITPDEAPELIQVLSGMQREIETSLARLLQAGGTA